MWLKPEETNFLDWKALWKFLIFIIKFSGGETDQVCGALFMLSSVVKLGQILPLGFFVDFHWDMSGNWVSIYNLCYNTVVLKKNSKTFKNHSFRTLKTGPAWAMPKIKYIFFLEVTKRDYLLSRTFYLIKIS